jgi:hypothetical protein
MNTFSELPRTLHIFNFEWIFSVIGHQIITLLHFFPIWNYMIWFCEI